MLDSLWEFWIDVGGTFTDCLARAPDGTLRRHKLLSSGVTKGRVADGSTRDFAIDDARRGDPPGFWIGWRLSLLDDQGHEVDSAQVTDFETTTGRLRLRGLTHTLTTNTAYELRCDLDAPIV